MKNKGNKGMGGRGSLWEPLVAPNTKGHACKSTFIDIRREWWVG